jgi:hypothetical protein
MNLSEVDAMAGEDGRDSARWRELRRVTNDRTLYEGFTAGGKQRKKETTKLGERDLQVLLDAGLFERCDPQQQKRFGTLLERVEVRKQRRRPLTYPQQLNEECDRWFHTLGSEIGDAVHAARLVQKGRKAVCYDLRQAFQQIALEETVRSYHAVQTTLGCIRHTTAGMGFQPSNDLCQEMLRVLRGPVDPAVMTWEHVDNVMMVSEDEERLREQRRRFTDRCGRAGAVLNVDDQNEPHTRGVFLGMQCDFDAGTVTITQDKRKKLQGMIDE